MALPIAPTPILKGEDSRKFNIQLKKNEKKRISDKERENAKEIMQRVLKKAKI